MAVYSIQKGIDVRMPRIRKHALVHRLRNQSLTRARPDADYLLFCDDDMMPRRDALIELLKHQAPIASALCVTREIPPEIAAKAYDEKEDRFVPLGSGFGGIDASFRPGAILRGKFGVGAAFALVSKETIAAMAEFYLSANDWLAMNQRMLNRLHVRAEMREKERQRLEALRRKQYEADGLVRIFQFSSQDNDLERGEDMHFSWLAIQVGIPILIDTNVKVAHIGDFPYHPDHLGINDVQDVRIVA